MARRRRHRRSGFSAPSYGLWLFLGGLLVSALASGLYLGYEKFQSPKKPPVTQPDEAPKSRLSVAAPQDGPLPPSPEPETVTTIPSKELPAPGRGARIALVIDDLGRSLQDLKILEALGIDLTYAVLPFESLTPRVVAELQRRGEEILCHLPMEPSNAANPGPGALRVSMSTAELVARTKKALAAVPGSAGVNNHMGSGLTTDGVRMASILQVLQEQDLFFLDSRTSADSVAYRVAVELGLPAAERQVFLDRDPAPEAIREQFRRTLEVARRRGAAIAIGHPYPATLTLLQEEVPRARELGFDFVPVSFLLDRSGGLPE